MSNPVDPAYEFDCPRFRNFDEAEDEHADVWFDGANEVSEATTQLFATTAQSTLTVPIQAMQIDEIEAAAEKAEEAVAEPVPVAEQAPAVAAESEMEIVAPEVVAQPEQQEMQIEPIVESTPIESSSAVVAPAEVESANASVILASADAAAEEEEDSLIAPTSDVTFSAEDSVLDSTCELGTRGSLVFSSALKRSSLPTLGESHAEIPIAAVCAVSAAAAAEAASNTSAEIEAAAAATDKQVDELHEEVSTMQQQHEEQEQVMASFVAAPSSTPLVAAVDATPLTHASHASVMEEVSPSDVAQSMLDKFSAVATPFKQSTDNVLPAVTPAAPSTVAKQPEAAVSTRKPSKDLSQSKSLPSFLRPTAAYIAKTAAAAAAKAQEDSTARIAAPSTDRAQITSRRSNAHALRPFPVQQPTAVPQQSAKEKDSTSKTPNPKKRRVAGSNVWDELSRPRTAVKKNRDDDVTSAAPTPAPGTARKNSASQATNGGAPKLTVAHSPAFATRARARGPAFLSSEEEELKKIAEEREKVSKEMKHNARLYQNVHDASSHAQSNGVNLIPTEIAALPVRSVVHLTQPEEFSFATARRAQSKAPLGEKDLNQPKEAPHKEKHTGELTKPQPFSFSTNNRARAHNAVKAVAMTREEQEAAEMAAIPKFKALPLNTAIFTSGGEMGVPRVQKAKLTDPTSPNLATKERGNKRKTEEETVAGAPEANNKDAKDAIPKSAKKLRSVAPFHLATEERGKRAEEEFERHRQEEEQKAREAREFVARPLYVSTIMGPAATPSRPTTGSATAPNSAAAPRELTVPQAPVHVLEHHQTAQQKFEEKKRLMFQAEKEAHNFKARPNPFSSGVTAEGSHVFEVKKSERPLTTPQEVLLASEARAIKRAEWDEEQARHEAELAQVWAKQKEEQAVREAKELATYRKSLVYKSQPAPKEALDHATFVPKLSVAKLTQPESPMLLTKRRAALLEKHGVHAAPLTAKKEKPIVTMDSVDEEVAAINAAAAAAPAPVEPVAVPAVEATAVESEPVAAKAQ